MSARFMDTPEPYKALIRYTSNIPTIGPLPYPYKNLIGGPMTVDVWIECVRDVDGNFVITNETQNYTEFALFTKYCTFTLRTVH